MKIEPNAIRDEYARRPASTLMVRRYGHVSRQMQINSANKLESFIQGVKPGSTPPASQTITLLPAAGA